MLAFDAHLDLAWNAIDWNRDLRSPVAEIRKTENLADGKGRGCNTVSLADMRRGQIGICIATLLPRLLRPNLMPAIQRYNSMAAAYAAARGQMAYYDAMVEEGQMCWIRNRDTLQTAVADWTKTTLTGKEPIYFVLSMEGADSVLSASQVRHWYDLGLRIIGPAHYGVSPYAHGTGTEGGLFPEGKDLLREMESVGMILDITHLSDQCFDEAMDLFGGPVLASHHNCRKLVPNQRQLTDAQIQELIKRNAVIGAALDNWMLLPNWIRGETDPKLVQLSAMIDHIDHVCQLAGNANHAAIGTDLDGGFGKEQSPSDLDTIADLQRLPEMLSQRGYKDAEIEGIMYRNWVNFFDRAWS